VDDADDDADDATDASANNNAMPRSMPSIKEANSSKGDDDDAPNALLLARFIQNFCLWIDGTVVIAIVVVRRRGGGMNRLVPRGDANGENKGSRGSGIVIGKAKIGRSESSDNWQ
jgi:hypothetical protein